MVTPRPVGRCLRGVLRCAASAAGAVVVVVAIRLTLGVWATAAVLATLAVGGLLVGWAAVEARTFGRDRSAHVVQGAGLSRDDHVAFARALTAVAQAYLAECEREARP